MEVTVYCPDCGGAISAPVRVKAVELSRMGHRVEVYFTNTVVEHTCEEKP